MSSGSRRENDSSGASRVFMTFSGTCGHEKIEADDTFVGKKAVDSDASLSIGGCGSTRTAPSQKAITSITATETLSTTKLTTLSACPHKNTGPNTTENENDIGLLMASNSENANDVVNINKFQTSLNDQPERGTDIVDSASRSTFVSGEPRIEVIGTNTIVPIDRGVSRFLYQAKPSTSERSAGLADGARNTHTTVKSISLMRHLVSLIAALAEGCHFIGIEREAEYVEIARQRIAAEAAKAP